MPKRYEFDEATLLSAFTVGVPGKRTFFLAIGEKEQWVRVWLEKDQLEALAMAIEQFLFTLSQEQPGALRGRARTALPDEAPSGLPSAELQVEEMVLGFEEGKATLKLSAHVFGGQDAEQAELSCSVTPSHLERLGARAASVCAGGRSRCPLCGGPIDPAGHVCPRYN